MVRTDRALTEFEQILLGLIVDTPRSGYDLKVFFAETPASVYEPSSGALYPGLRRLEQRGLLVSERVPSAGRRARVVYRATAEGTAVHLAWLKKPVDPSTIGRDLGTHLMRFVLAEGRLSRDEVLAFLADLASALEQFVLAMERFQSGSQSHGQHGSLALGHGIAVHRASLEWVHATIQALQDSPAPASRPQSH